ncbi:hypothetical protein [Candidatus Enterococcus moelleringii]|nr:hypothetical protein [Enterococcus sp. 669A]
METNTMSGIKEMKYDAADHHWIISNPDKKLTDGDKVEVRK